LKDADPGGITEYPEGFGKPEKDFFRGHGISDGGDLCLVNESD
jgi:hypothetical protein